MRLYKLTNKDEKDPKTMINHLKIMQKTNNHVKGNQLNHLEYHIRKANLTVASLSRLTGIAGSTIHDLKVVGANPTLKTARAISEALGVAIDSIWGRDDG